MAYENTTFDPAMESDLEQGRDALRRARVRTREATEDTVDLIRRNPGRTIVISLLAGAAIGALAMNAALERQETRWDRFAGYGEEAWDRMRAGWGQAAESLRSAVRSWLESAR